MFAAKNELLTRPSGYNISRSLRFRSSASAYLSRTPASTSNQKTFTFSAWVKRGLLGSATYPIIATAGASIDYFGFNADSLRMTLGTATGALQSTAVYRDPSAWYHVVFVVDTTSATSTITGTSTDRMRMYVNGVQITSFTTVTVPALNATTNFNLNTVAGQINLVAGLSVNDMYLAEVNFIDGQALTPSSFGAFDTNGVWQPAKYTGTYGTNGFYLPYSDPSGSGNGNDTYTKLLLHGNGLNDSAWNGSSNHALTAFGSATTSTTQTKFGMSSSLYTLGSSSQYFRTDASADFTYGAASGTTNDFTVDFWFYPGTSGTTNPYIEIGNNLYSSFLIYQTTFYASSNNTAWDISSGNSIGAPTAGQWNHFAIVRSGSTWYTFLNGVQQSTWTNSSAGYNYTTNNYLQIGFGQNAFYSTGYYSELRWSAGIARWTSNFTPPTVPYSGGAGSDSSGNVNAWRPFNINTSTSGTTYDSMIDSPTNYADGGNGRGNYATLNPVNSFASTITNGNLSGTCSTNANSWANATIALPSSGKFYWEYKCTDTAGVNARDVVGFAKQTLLNTVTFANNADSGGWYCQGSMSGMSGGNVNSQTFTNGNVIGVAVDCSTGNFWYSKDGAWVYGDPVAGTNPSSTLVSPITQWVPAFGMSSNTTAYPWSGDVNFGQRPFSATPPSGYSALNTQNLPSPVIANGSQHFNVALDTGANIKTTSQALYTYYLEWIKDRANVNNHQLADTVRGNTNILQSNTTAAETTYTAPTGNSVGWVWNANATSASNTSGSITSTVSANTSAGFSVVTFTAQTSGTATVGHGLGVAPSFYIVKTRANANNWAAYHVSTGNGGYILLNTTGAYTTDANVWANTSPTSSVFTLGTDWLSAGTMVAYCFAPVSGYSAFGSYTGNGSATGDGPFIYTGFRPRFILVKRTDTTSDWVVYDTTRDTYNTASNWLRPNTSTADTAYAIWDFLSNGFKSRYAAAETNASGGTYIYAAFAENPFKYSRAR